MIVTRYAKVETTTGMIFREGQNYANVSLLESLEENGFDVFMSIPTDVSGATHYWDYANEEWAMRPTLPAFSNPYDLTALPVGTIVYVTNESGERQEITDLNEYLVLTGPQKFRVDVKPPVPYVKLTERVEVT